MPKKNLQVSDLFAKLDVNKDGPFGALGALTGRNIFYPEVIGAQFFFDDLGFFCWVLSRPSWTQSY